MNIFFRIKMTVTILVLSVQTITVAQSMSSTNYGIPWDVADAGGGTLMSTNYTLTDSTGQPTAIGTQMSAGFTLEGGFEAVPDDDEDSVKSFMDNCIFDPNMSQYDSNGDGFGNICDPDLTNDGVVNFADYALLVSAFLSMPGDANWNEDADLSGDGAVNFIDIARFQFFFLQPPGPSGIN